MGCAITRDFCFKQKGQAIVAALIIMLLSVSGLVLMYNTGQATSEKWRVVNAADAAAYSGGLWIARQLNFMAYTNRAMIANHVAVGHFVSFVSWARNTEQNVEFLDTIANVFPIIKPYTEPAERYAELYLEVTERFGRGYVRAIDLFNRGLYASQVAARVNLNGLVVNDVMRQTARNYGDIQVNDQEDLRVLSQRSLSVGNSGRAAQAAGRVIGQFVPLLSFTQSYDATRDNGRIAGVVEASLDSSERWIRGDRGWQYCLDGERCNDFPFNYRLTKRGSTVHSVDGGDGQSRRNECSRFSRLFGQIFEGTSSSSSSREGDGLNWYSRDETQLEQYEPRRRRPGFRWQTQFLTCAEANATEFSSSYQGIANYHALRNQNGRHQTLSVYAYATLDTDASAVPVYHTFREGNPSDPHYEVKRRQAITHDKTTALVEAQVFHGSDEANLFSTEEGQEYSNLFNPYWHARSNFGVYDRVAATIAGIHD